MAAELWLRRAMALARQRGGGDKPMVWECSVGAGGPFIRPGEGAGVVKAGNGRCQYLGLKVSVTGVFKSGGGAVYWGNEGGGDATSFSLQRRWSGAAMGAVRSGCRQRLARSGLVREDEEEGRQVSWQVPSLRGNVFPEIRQGCTRANWADEGKRQPKKEWANAVKKEEGGR
jgi:hypothetical protein